MINFKNQKIKNNHILKFKSLSSVNGYMHCDGSFGPLLVRKETIKNFFGSAPFTYLDRLMTFTGPFIQKYLKKN